MATFNPSSTIMTHILPPSTFTTSAFGLHLTPPSIDTPEKVIGELGGDLYIPPDAQGTRNMDVFTADGPVGTPTLPVLWSGSPLRRGGVKAFRLGDKDTGSGLDTGSSLDIGALARRILDETRSIKREAHDLGTRPASLDQLGNLADKEATLLIHALTDFSTDEGVDRLLFGRSMKYLYEAIYKVGRPELIGELLVDLAKKVLFLPPRKPAFAMALVVYNLLKDTTELPDESLRRSSLTNIALVFSSAIRTFAEKAKDMGTLTDIEDWTRDVLFRLPVIESQISLSFNKGDMSPVLSKDAMDISYLAALRDYVKGPLLQWINMTTTSEAIGSVEVGRWISASLSLIDGLLAALRSKFQEVGWDFEVGSSSSKDDLEN